MRPMTETRKRRLSDPQLLANKRLTNGFSKTDHVTTRSQAKNEPSSRVSPSRKVKHKSLTTEERRLMISMRLRHEEQHTTQASLKVAHQEREENTGKHLKRSSRLLSMNGRTNGLHSSPVKSSRRIKLRTKVLGSVNQHHQNDIRSRGHENSLKKKMATQVKNREIRAKKRRSALWVLNCEAEEFLFGETAAEDQEVELPPINSNNSPPKKRRRMRATELGDLLKGTPLLESKLRTSVTECSENESSSETSEVTASSSNVEAKRKETRRDSRTKNSSRVQEKVEMESSLSEEEDDDEDEDEDDSNLDFPNLSYTLMLEAAAAAAASSSSSTSLLLNSSTSEQSVRIKRILNSIEYTFSFENVPSSEVWYRTFCHQNRPRYTFHDTTSPDNLVILPYEAKGLKSELTKRLRRPPRKSPRCHASTQAILSALKPTRSGRLGAGASSVATSPSPSAPSTSAKSKQINIASHIQETPVASSSSSSVRYLMGSQLSNSTTPTGTNINTTLPQLLPVSTLIPSNAIQNGIKACDITATQYLWDVIQYLSDPYVVHVLRLCDPRFKGRNKTDSDPSQLSPEKSSLEKTVGSIGSKRMSTVYVNHNNNVKSPLKLVIPSPKTSPRFSGSTISSPGTPPVLTYSQNGSCSKLELRRVLRSPTPSSPTISPGSAIPPGLSQLSSPSSTHSSCSGSSSSTVRKSMRKSSGLIVSEEANTFHVNSKHYTCSSVSKFNKSPKLSHFSILPPPSLLEEALFSSTNSLPDFPWDTFI